MSNVNVARFARNIKWDFFCDFQTLCKGLKKSIANWAKKQATQHHLEVRQGVRQKHQWSLGYKLAKKIVLTPIHKKLGLDKCVDTHVPMSSSAAPLNLDTFEYLQSLGNFHLLTLT